MTGTKRTRTRKVINSPKITLECPRAVPVQQIVPAPEEIARLAYIKFLNEYPRRVTSDQG